MKEILRENKEAVSDAGLAVQQVVGEMVGVILGAALRSRMG